MLLLVKELFSWLKSVMQIVAILSKGAAAIKLLISGICSIIKKLFAAIQIQVMVKIIEARIVQMMKTLNDMSKHVNKGMMKVIKNMA